MTSTDAEEPWDPQVAADRLASLLVDVLDHAGRVDQGVSRADLFYVADKARALSRAAEQLRTLASELLDENTAIGAYAPLTEKRLQSAGRLGYPVVQKLHPAVAS